jgi:ABC-type histidine transport system ATPase subunit
MFIYGGSPYAQEQKVNEIVTVKVDGVITMSEAKEIISYLYSAGDSKEILRRLDKEKEYPPENRVLTTREEQIVDRQKTTTAVINYKRFKRVDSTYGQIVTNFIFEGHRAYLAPFNELFARFDSDRNGVLSEVGENDQRLSSKL